MTENSIKSQNIRWHHGKLSAQDRKEKLGQSGAVLWLTGLSGSGKSTVAREVELALVENGVNAFVLDGDNVRHGLNANLGFSPEDRKENIRRISHVAQLFAEANVVVITAFISPYTKDRDAARELIGAHRFFEVLCDTPLEVCEERDPKGLYQKARSGEIKMFTGISAPYERPEQPDLVLQTGSESLEATTRRVLDLLIEKDIVSLGS